MPAADWASRPAPFGQAGQTIPLRLEDNSSYLNFPGDTGVVRYGKGFSSATVPTTRATRR